MKESHDYDFIVIGSGFGGSVSACRLSEKGYKVAVLEMGKRWKPEDFPKTNWNLKRYFWAPLFRCFGFFRLSLFRHAWVLSGVGVGGGSLVYANVLLEPDAKVWQDPAWKDLEDWKSVMPSFYQRARTMLGAEENPHLGPADRMLKESAEAEKLGDSFKKTTVGVYFGNPGETVSDPYFGGQGPDRTGCKLCGGCMVGCRHGAKNSLDFNYLYFAEKQGARIFPDTEVLDVQPLQANPEGKKGYQIFCRENTPNGTQVERSFKARGIVFSAGVLGTLPLLLKLRQNGSLPNLSARLGDQTRTNSESLIGIRCDDAPEDLSEGIAIGSGFMLDEETQVEAVRYPKGSDVMGLTATLMTHSTPGWRRISAWLMEILKKPIEFLKTLKIVGWAEKSIILLVMQTCDSSFQMRLKRSWWCPWKKSLKSVGKRVPPFIEPANRFAEKMAQRFQGKPLTALTEIFFNVPTTAHILGGSIMGKSSSEGVIDSQNRVFHYKNMYVCDGSMIGANLGVNPSLTITALSERAMSHVPSKAENPDFS